MRSMGCVLMIGASIVLLGCGGNPNTTGRSAGSSASGATVPRGEVDPAKVVGTWKMAKADPATATVAIGSEIELTKDGVYKILGGPGGKGATTGSYKVEGDKTSGYTLMTKIQLGAAPNLDQFKILKLTDKELIRQTRAGDVEEFSRVK